MPVLNKYGPEGATYYCCIKAFYAYCFPLVVAGFVTALHSDLSHFFFILLGISWLLGTRRIFSLQGQGRTTGGTAPRAVDQLLRHAR